MVFPCFYLAFSLLLLGLSLLLLGLSVTWPFLCCYLPFFAVTWLFLLLVNFSLLLLGFLSFSVLFFAFISFRFVFLVLSNCPDCYRCTVVPCMEKVFCDWIFFTPIFLFSVTIQSHTCKPTDNVTSQTSYQTTANIKIQLDPNILIVYATHLLQTNTKYLKQNENVI